MRRYSFKDVNGGISPGAVITAVLFILLIGFFIFLGREPIEQEVPDQGVLGDDVMVSPEERLEEVFNTLQEEDEVILTEEELEEINETLKIIENNPS